MTENNKDIKITPLEGLLGKTLTKNTGEEIPTSSLAAKKQIFLYFSAHWCPPCREFTPLLSTAFEEYKTKTGDKCEVEVIFISRDNEVSSFEEYHKEMSFPAVNFNVGRSEELAKKFGVDGIPCIVAVNEQGEAVHSEADAIDLRGIISSHGARAFPLTQEHMAELKAEEEAEAARSLKKLYDGDIPLKVKGDEGGELSLKQIMEKSDYVGILLGDGDASDKLYDDVKEEIEKVCGDKKSKCPLLYLGWKLYDGDSDHNKVSSKFDHSFNELSDEIRQGIENVIGKDKARLVPQLIILRRGMGLCNMDGKCEDENTPVIVSTDPGAGKLRTAGAAAFPWDEAAMKVFEEAEKAEVENLKSKMTDLKLFTEPETCEPVVLSQNNEDSLKDQLFVGSGDGVVGLYFSAHWCPPCRQFTPKLVKCYEDAKAAGNKFEVIFISSDSSKTEFEEYYSSMVTSTGCQFMALDYKQRDLKKKLSKLFDVDGIPTLVLLKSDGSVITADGTRAVGVGGASTFPWDDTTLERVEREKQAAAAKKEKDDEVQQRAAGCAVVQRICGPVGGVGHDINDRVLTFDSFATVGVPGLYATSGVVYYELDILQQDGVPQLGFAQKDGVEPYDGHCGKGIGDNKTSWGLDGLRSCKWHGGDIPWPCLWEVGNTIGIAANIDKGAIAVSKDGDWTEDGWGVVFNDAGIKQGVYPCFSAESYQLRYRLTPADWKYEPPVDSLWQSHD